MDATALLLSRIQFAFTISFHIIFPAFTIGLAAWLTVLEALHLATGRPAYRVIFEFWLKIFGVAFGMGVVSGVVMAFEFGTNWSELSKMSGGIMGVLLSYETFTAFFLEASFFGILLFGRPRVAPWFYLFSTAMVALGTTLSAYWIMANNTWRGVAFEFRYKTERMRWVWDVSFAGGSLVAAFVQGLTVGALVEGLPVTNGLYAGGDFGWFSPFAALCGIGLCLGYALLGACWLVKKCDADIRNAAYRLISYLLVGVLVFLAVVFIYALAENLPIMHRWIDRPYLFIFPAVGAVAAFVLAASARRRRDRWPFYMAAVIFVSAFGTLAISFWPYMIPFVITIDEAAAPHSSLAFMFWGEGLFVFPLMLLYTAISYRVFRGKVGSTSGHY